MIYPHLRHYANTPVLFRDRLCLTSIISVLFVPGQSFVATGDAENQGIDQAILLSSKLDRQHMGVSINRDTPNGWFIVENPTKRGWLWGIPIFGSLHMALGNDTKSITLL